MLEENSRIKEMPYLLIYLLTIYFYFYPQKTKAEGHNELWNIFLFSLRKAKYIILLNTTLLVEIFILKMRGQENALFIDVILVYPGNYGVIYIYILVYTYIHIYDCK